RLPSQKRGPRPFVRERDHRTCHRPVYGVWAGTQSMSPALRNLEQVLLEGHLAHGDHPILSMCASNAVVDSKDSSNRKLSKKRALRLRCIRLKWPCQSCPVSLRSAKITVKTRLYALRGSC